MHYRLGLDIGANSIGWCILSLDEHSDPNGIIRTGVRIFSDGRNPKDKSSLAVARREARQQRRRRDRYLKRRSRIMRQLVELGLMPKAETQRKSLELLNPYHIRAIALDSKVPLHHLGRAIFHLNQRRGFKSNRKNLSAGDEDPGIIKGSISATRKAMEELSCRTFGELLNKRYLAGLGVRARRTSDGKDYELYCDRAMTEAEFDALWAAQAPHHADALTEEARLALRDTLLFQRPLRPIDPGRCTFEPSEQRIAVALPSSQRRRIYQDLNHIRLLDPTLTERPLSLAERNLLAAELETSRKITFAKMKTLLGLKRSWQLNLEDEKRKHLDGNLTSVLLSDSKVLGMNWFSMPEEAQDGLVQLMINARDDEELVGALVADYGFSEKVAASFRDITLPDGYGRLGPTATKNILKHLKAEVITYDKAALKAGYHHSNFYTGEIFDSLPYYGEVLERHVAGGSGDPEDDPESRYGKVTNPTVHIGMNQLRKLANALIDKYGHPSQIHIEFARDLKMGLKQKKELIRRQKDDQDKNDRYRAELSKLGLPDNYNNRLLLRLWEELGAGPLERRCPFTGEQISLSMLFGPEVEIEHLLPFTKSLDDSVGNKTVCVRRANRDKGNRSPYEAFGNSPEGYDWEEITARAKSLPGSKSWRFSPDAMDRIAEDDDFLARHLNDTAYLSRLAKEYLSAICPPAHIYPIPGRLTAMLRHHWGLNSILSADNSKDRTDHRHHAIDAVVVACTDRGTLNGVSKASGRSHRQGSARAVEAIDEPFRGFRDKVRGSVSTICVSHKPEHGISGQLHLDTAYGLASEPDSKGIMEVVFRVPVTALKPGDIDGIRDARLRGNIKELTKGLSGKDYNIALQKFSEATGVKRIRILRRKSVIHIKDRNGRSYKGYDGNSNYGMEIFEDDSGVWRGELISTFRAAQPDYRAFLADRDKSLYESFSGHRLAMRLRPGDTIAMGESENRRIYRIQVISGNNIVLAEAHESNADKRNRDKNNQFKYTNKTPSTLAQAGARRVFVDLLGNVLDPKAHAAANY